jgi:hypothetical protein
MKDWTWYLPIWILGIGSIVVLLITLAELLTRG